MSHHSSIANFPFLAILISTEFDFDNPPKLSSVPVTRAFDESVRVKEQARADAIAAVEAVSSDGFKEITNTINLTVPKITNGFPYTTLNFGRKKSLLEIFSCFFPVDFVVKVLVARTRGKAAEKFFFKRNGAGNSFIMKYNYKEIMQFISIFIFILGENDAPKKSDGPNGKALRTAITNARASLMAVLDAEDRKKVIGIDRLERLFAHFYIGEEFQDEFNQILLDTIGLFGEQYSGDEKADKFLGVSPLVRKTPNKPAKITIWHYQACCILKDGSPYCTYLKTHRTKDGLPMKIDVPTCDWGDQILEKGGKATTLFMDKLYHTQSGLGYLRSRNVTYIVSAMAQRAAEFCAMTWDKVTKQGEWSGIYNKEKKIGFVDYWSPIKTIDRKHVMSYNLTLTVGRPRRVNEIPIWHIYGLGFKACDEMNSRLNGNRFPHRRGGKHTRGDEAHIFAFHMSILMQNTLSAYTDSNECARPSMRDACRELSSKLMRANI